jgi:hypothetical protein
MMARAKSAQLVSGVPEKWWVPPVRRRSCPAAVRSACAMALRAWATDLVGNDVQAFTLAAQTEHGLDEVRPVRGDDPGGAQDQVLAPGVRTPSSPCSLDRP